MQQAGASDGYPATGVEPQRMMVPVLKVLEGGSSAADDDVVEGGRLAEAESTHRPETWCR